MARRLEEPSFEASHSRNVHLYDNEGQILGDVFQNGSLTHRRFYNFCSRFLVFPPENAQWRIFALNHDGSAGNQIAADATNLAPGRYIILGPDGTPVPVSLSAEPYPRRVLSRTADSKLTPKLRQRAYFRQVVRSRDRDCMISGMRNPLADLGRYTGLEVAHIFPQARVIEWRQRGFQQLVTDNSAAYLIGTSKIHSPQNGILLSSVVHALFDNFSLSINPDDGYLITSFMPDTLGIDGRILDPRCRNDADINRVNDHLLRWHFHTAVVANMRGVATEPPWEMDFPDGDMMGEILETPDAALRMETELFHRLGSGENAFDEGIQAESSQNICIIT
ncbi:hypothetical protein CIHG_10515 [Coccidioides immitis H538.4]|uniref:HNH nuclease domain-containing protein n=1 Tax=Coccidioides immitis H538.4 TaxID=396776 RepID=A0A0J8S6C5_COCIT|nr:hypothetical protein CIHG_10515 [Coccidioides immitis H538.4]